MAKLNEKAAEQLEAFVLELNSVEGDRIDVGELSQLTRTVGSNKVQDEVRGVSYSLVRSEQEQARLENYIWDHKITKADFIEALREALAA